MNQPELADAWHRPATNPFWQHRTDVQHVTAEQISAMFRRAYGAAENKKGCPKCGGPSLNGGVCLGCVREPMEPSAETPWGV